MNCSECLPRRVKATQLIEWIHVPSENLDGRGNDLGILAREGLCDEHALELVRTTDRRYIITPLAARRGETGHKPGEQLKWEVDEGSGSRSGGVSSTAK